VAVITTMGKFCYIECDSSNCNKKMEHNDLKMLKDLAKSCGWQNKGGDNWICPNCKELAKKKK